MSHHSSHDPPPSNNPRLINAFFNESQRSTPPVSCGRGLGRGASNPVRSTPRDRSLMSTGSATMAVDPPTPNSAPPSGHMQDSTQWLLEKHNTEVKARARAAQVAATTPIPAPAVSRSETMQDLYDPTPTSQTDNLDKAFKAAINSINDICSLLARAEGHNVHIDNVRALGASLNKITSMWAPWFHPLPNCRCLLPFLP